MKLGNVLKGYLVILLFFSLMMVAKTTKADVIWEPNDNFYLEHHQDCENVDRNYTANGKKGYVTLYKNPESHKKVENYSNGTTFLVSFTYKDKKGVEWGVIEKNNKTGWAPMDELALIYDNISFYKDHKSEIDDYQGELDDYVVVKPIILWSYPGSGVINNHIQAIDDNFLISYTYTDEDNRLWGYVAYLYSSKGWVCISDPTDENIPTKENQSTVTIIPPSNNFSLDETDEEDSNQITILAILVVSLIIATTCLIRILYKKGDENKNSQDK